MKRRAKFEIALSGARSREWLQALQFILDVMNDPSLPDDLRDRAAIVALPLVHDRISPPDEEDSTSEGELLQ